jgi:hypothetical protein
MRWRKETASINYALNFFFQNNKLRICVFSMKDLWRIYSFIMVQHSSQQHTNLCPWIIMLLAVMLSPLRSYDFLEQNKCPTLHTVEKNYYVKMSLKNLQSSSHALSLFARTINLKQMSLTTTSPTRLVRLSFVFLLFTFLCGLLETTMCDILEKLLLWLKNILLM